MKLQALCENLVYSKDLIAEHGLSLYLHTDDLKVLIDTGQGFALLNNMKKLKIEPDSIDYLILTHGHYDHTGGLMDLLKIRSKPLNIYAHPSLFTPKYVNRMGMEIYAGIQFNMHEYETEGALFHFINEETTLDSLTIYPKSSLPFDTIQTNPHFIIKDNDTTTHDLFEDELTITVLTENGTSLFTGCAHNGIIEIISAVMKKKQVSSFHTVAGGFHLRETPQSYLEETFNLLQKCNVEQLAVTHCTGIDSYSYFKNMIGRKADYLYCGKEIQL
jgi:7,8-dihydropterin-6-yl-methyl-4-(beta-D-ribofuranosyl)aminobenzene 5'-phosphate synthase